jgi:DNA invertase Pin-like site-specific DNA recombinase
MAARAKRAFSYVRFSKPEQLKGDSLRRQLEWGEGLCQQKGWTLDDSLKLRDLGVSAFRGKNAATGRLAAFLDAIKAGKVRPGDVLIVESLDRLSRQDVDTGWEIFRGILKSGVEIYTREPERLYLPGELNDLGTRIGVQVFLERAYNESSTKSMRGRSFWQARRAQLDSAERKPIHQNPPAWLRLTEDKTKFAVIPEAARAVRLIYKWAGEGLGLDPITARLNQRGVPPITAGLTKKGEPRKRCTGKVTDSWRRSYVAKLLADKAVIGEYQPHVMKDGKRVPVGEPIKDYFPRIIPEQQWYAVRQAVKERGTELGPKGVGIANLFTGLIRDARDGQTMHLVYAGSSRKGNTRRLVSYGCRNGEPSSVRLEFPYDIIEEAFLESIRELKASDVLGGKVDEREEEIAALSAKLGELDGKIVKVQKRVMAESGIEALMSLLEKLDRERKATAAELEKLKAETARQQPEEALSEVQSLAELLNKVKGDERKELRLKIRARIKQLVREMWLYVWDVTPTIRGAQLQVILHSGKVWAYLFAWLHRRGGPYYERGVTTGVGQVVGYPGDHRHLAHKLLRDYCTDAKVRRFFDRLSGEAYTEGIMKAIEAEIEWRKAHAAVEAFARMEKEDEGNDSLPDDA